MKKQASLGKTVAPPATKDRVGRSLVDDKPLTRIYACRSVAVIVISRKTEIENG